MHSVTERVHLDGQEMQTCSKVQRSLNRFEIISPQFIRLQNINL